MALKKTFFKILSGLAAFCYWLDTLFFKVGVFGHKQVKMTLL